MFISSLCIMPLDKLVHIVCLYVSLSFSGIGAFPISLVS